MSENLNVNVLVEAKKEYTNQLIKTIQPEIYLILLSIYEDSQKNNGRRSVSYSNFQMELKQVPNWTSFKLEDKLAQVTKKYPYLMDLITAIFVSHVKILSCVRLRSDNKSIKIKVPSLNIFLHKLIIKCCETIYYKPKIIHEDKRRVIEIIEDAIMDTITNQIPIEYILNEYLSGAFDDENDNSFNIDNPVENEGESEGESEGEGEEDEFGDDESVLDSEKPDDVKSIPILQDRPTMPVFNFAQPGEVPQIQQNEMPQMPQTQMQQMPQPQQMPQQIPQQIPQQTQMKQPNRDIIKAEKIEDSDDSEEYEE